MGQELPEFESVEAMLRSPRGRATLLRWSACGAGVGLFGFVALGGWFRAPVAGIPFAAGIGVFAGLAAWYFRERWRELGSGPELGGPAEWEAEGRRLEELKSRAPHDSEAAAAYVAQLESMVEELRELRDNPPRGFGKLKLPTGEIVAALERDLVEARSFLPRGAV